MSCSTAGWPETAASCSIVWPGSESAPATWETSYAVVSRASTNIARPYAGRRKLLVGLAAGMRPAIGAREHMFTPPILNIGGVKAV